jgi:hypothetical protein
MFNPASLRAEGPDIHYKLRCKTCATTSSSRKWTAVKLFCIQTKSKRVGSRRSAGGTQFI